MSSPLQQPDFRLTQTEDYRERYANSVQVRVSVWDFCIYFGLLKQQTETTVEVENHAAIYLSPQQAKALYKILEQNVINYEQAFGEIKLDARNQAQPRPLN
ncbi:MAG: DUF3467 domain-containing protein [Acidobacteriales bacterium]|nr:DUF3467 domain-containing protein [Terriglobales bacterium]